MKTFIIFIFVVFLINIISSQEKKQLDSLMTLINSEKSDSIKVELLLKAGEVYEFVDFNSALKYYNQASDYCDQKKMDKMKTKVIRYTRIMFRDQATLEDFRKWFNISLDHASKTNDLIEKAMILNDMGIKQDSQGNTDSALTYYNKSFKIYLNILKNDPQNIEANKGLAYNSNNIGSIYWNIGDLDKAIKYFNQGIFRSKKAKNIYSLTNLLLNKGQIYKQKSDYDTAMYFYEMAFNECAFYLKNAKTKKDSTDAEEGIGKCLNSMSYVYSKTGEYDKAIEKISEARKKINKNDKITNGNCLFNLGQVYYNKGDYVAAIECFVEASRLFESIRDNNDQAIVLSKIGDVFIDQNSLDQALVYYLQSKELIEKFNNNPKGLAPAYLDLGNIYHLMFKPDSALIFLEKAMSLYTELGNKYGISNCYGTMGAVYDAKKMYSKAIEYYLLAIELKKETNDRKNMALINNGLALSYLNLKNYSLAIKYAFRAIEIAEEIGSKAEIQDAYQRLYMAYEASGDTKNGMKYLKLYINIKDSLFNSEKEYIIRNLETQYQTEKKDAEIKIQKSQIQFEQAQKEIAEKESLRKEREKNFSLIGLGLVIILVIFIFRSYRQKRKANILLATKNEQITQQKEEIQSQRDLVVQQRDLIMEQKQEITDSIHYAYRIQSAAIPPHEQLRERISDYFVFYRPRDIVSGDFYWIGKQDGKIIIIAADCTGHGVPGAFMSMLGIALINEIVQKENITRPSEILNKLRDSIIKALQQSGKNDPVDSGQTTKPTYSSNVKDGMDVATVTIDIEKGILEFAGANNPLYLIRNNELLEKKGNKMPVSIHIQMEPYLNHEFSVNKGDNIYIFSDGFPDQFGGPKGKKFKYQPFKELLTGISDSPMPHQKIILEQKFNEWKGDFDQIDDVLVIGIKI
jgi:tetratricopeptide (TPR) repeat protein